MWVYRIGIYACVNIHTGRDFAGRRKRQVLCLARGNAIERRSSEMSGDIVISINIITQL